MARFNIREATERDCDDMMAMVKELAAHENQLESVTCKADDLQRDGFGEQQWFHAFVAESTTEGLGSGWTFSLDSCLSAGSFLIPRSDGKLLRPLVGYAMYHYGYNSYYGKRCKLGDLYVAKEWRQIGVGSALLATVCQTALSLGCTHMDWGAYSWNQPAIDFYKNIGAYSRSEGHGFLLFCMEKDAMEKLVAKTVAKMNTKV